MDNIKNYLNRSPKYKALQKPLEAAEVCNAARTLAKSRYQIISFSRGLLTLGVQSPAEAMILQAESANIIRTINEKLGREAISKLRYKIQ